MEAAVMCKHRTSSKEHTELFPYYCFLFTCPLDLLKARTQILHMGCKVLEETQMQLVDFFYIINPTKTFNYSLYCFFSLKEVTAGVLIKIEHFLIQQHDC